MLAQKQVSNFSVKVRKISHFHLWHAALCFTVPLIGVQHKIDSRQSVQHWLTESSMRMPRTVRELIFVTPLSCYRLGLQTFYGHKPCGFAGRRWKTMSGTTGSINCCVVFIVTDTDRPRAAGRTETYVLAHSVTEATIRLQYSVSQDVTGAEMRCVRRRQKDGYTQTNWNRREASLSLKNPDNETNVMQQRMAKLNCCSETQN